MIINDFWQAIKPALALNKAKGYFDVPLLNLMLGGGFAQNTPQCVEQWNFTSPNNFTLKFPIAAPVIDSTCSPYLLCIRYIVNNTVYRYKLWSTAGDNKIFAPLYTGQPILKNFCIEIWSLTISSNSDNTANIGDDHGADNIIPSGSTFDTNGGGGIYYTSADTFKYGPHYYYDPLDDGGVTRGYWTGAAYLTNGSIFTPTINDELRGPHNADVTSFIKYCPDQLFNFVPLSADGSAQKFRLYTSQLKTKTSFGDADLFAPFIAPSTACSPVIGAQQANNLNNYPVIGSGVGSLPLHFNTCISATKN